MKIAVCEDEEVIAQEIWKLFFDILDVEVKYFTNPIDFLNRYKAGERFDVLFCDVVMEHIDGINLCRQIRGIDDNIYIVFITNYIEFAPKGYELGLFRYLLKPVCKADVEKVIADIMKDAAGHEKILLKGSAGKSIVINVHDIAYVEIHDKQACVHYGADSLVIEKSMAELELLLNRKLFYRIHRKYIVNMECIRELEQHTLCLDSGVKLPISYRKAHDFKEAFYKFLGVR